jgi:hypothetical protein
MPSMHSPCETLRHLGAELLVLHGRFSMPESSMQWPLRVLDGMLDGIPLDGIEVGMWLKLLTLTREDKPRVLNAMAGLLLLLVDHYCCLSAELLRDACYATQILFK